MKLTATHSLTHCIMHPPARFAELLLTHTTSESLQSLYYIIKRSRVCMPVHIDVYFARHTHGQQQQQQQQQPPLARGLSRSCSHTIPRDRFKVYVKQPRWMQGFKSCNPQVPVHLRNGVSPRVLCVPGRTWPYEFLFALCSRGSATAIMRGA